jgi:hypothetical protein
MWYREAIKYNIYGLPIAGDPLVSEFAGEDEEADVEVKPLEEPENEDPSPEDDFTPEDLEQKVEQITNDPTAGLRLPPLHNNCRCQVKTLPVLSQPGIRDGRRVWERSEFCCEICRLSAEAFNAAEIQRLRNKGINLD